MVCFAKARCRGRCGFFSRLLRIPFSLSYLKDRHGVYGRLLREACLLGDEDAAGKTRKRR